jgi:hypothetical protein
VQGPDEPVDHDPAGIGIRLRWAALAVAGGGLVAAPSAAASLTALPSPFFPLRAVPPLRATAGPTETRFPGSLSSTQEVRISVDTTGRPFRVVDVNRIALTRKGDYSFVVGAPVEDVRAAAGSGSEPGLRPGAVVWQGFSPGERSLAAAITLRTQAAASALPLRIEIEGSQLRLVNVTSASATTVDANVSAVDVARALDAARTALESGAPSPAPVVKATGAAHDVRLVARIPLQVRGTVRYAGSPARQVAAVVGADPLEISGAGDLKALELSVSVPEPASVLRAPGAGHWLDLARSGQLPGGREATRLAVNRLLAAALAVQFQEFLANPDLNGVARTSYRYTLATRPKPAAVQSPENGRGWALAVAVALALVAATAGALVLWAHS